MAGEDDDAVPLRGTGAKKLIVYRDDNFVGCAGWLCCASVGPPSAVSARPRFQVSCPGHDAGVPCKRADFLPRLAQEVRTFAGHTRSFCTTRGAKWAAPLTPSSPSSREHSHRVLR